MCNSWKFNEYCPVPNSSNVNTLASIESKKSQTIKQKSKKNYYKDDHVYLFASIRMNHTVQVRI